MIRWMWACAVATGFAMTDAVVARPYDLEVFLHVIGSAGLPQGGYRYIDSQDQVSIAIRLVNQGDVPVQFPPELDSLLQVELVRSGSAEPVVTLRERVVKWRRAENVPTLSPMVGHESVEVTFHFRPVGASLGPGSYRLRVDISSLGARLTASDGTPWRGTWPGASEKTVLVSPSANRAEWIQGRALRASAHAIRGEQEAAVRRSWSSSGWHPTAPSVLWDSVAWSWSDATTPRPRPGCSAYWIWASRPRAARRACSRWRTSGRARTNVPGPSCGVVCLSVRRTTRSRD